MTETNHFDHKDHPLKLIENLEMIVSKDGDGEDEKKGAICCCGCQEPISGGSAYGCIPCRYFLHRICAQLEPTINSHFHLRHPLILFDRTAKSTWRCDVCRLRNRRKRWFNYCCELCDFDACMNCVDVASAHEAAAVAIKEEAAIKFEHEGHPEHTLTLQLRPATFLCDACKTEDKDLFYRCNSCDFWIHKTCASLAPTIDLRRHHKHPLLLVYSLPDKFYNYSYYCGFCVKLILESDWIYHCANCRYFAHIKCALNAAKQPSTRSDGPSTSDAEEQMNDHELLHFPMSYAFKDPLKVLHFEKIAQNDDDTTEINHWSHNHPLILNVESQNNTMVDIGSDDPIEVCYGCVRPLSFPYYSCKDGCAFSIHKYCAELPRILKHQVHPDHLLNLIDFEDPEFVDHKCSVCYIFGNTFFYKCEPCKFYLDVNCAFLPNTIKHKSHKHPLIQVMDPNPYCKACDEWSNGISYACKACNFQLCQDCAVKSPHSLAHRYCKGHQIPLTYPPVEDHPEDFYCDICEIEMHPKLPLYHCHKCKNSFHLRCLSKIDYYSNFCSVGTRTFSYHKHPLTYVRRKKTPSYVCFGCNLDINDHLILECRTGTCPFRICMQCHYDKT